MDLKTTPKTKNKFKKFLDKTYLYIAIEGFRFARRT
jgi:hypothetical protein